MSSKKSNFIVPLVLLLVVAAAITVTLIANKKSKTIVVASKETVIAEVEVANSAETIVEQNADSIVEMKEDPNTAFPSMLAEAGDADAELASAFTYENLQDSMLTSGQEARQAVKSRAAWSRFGERGNTEVWEDQMAAMKKEIQESGQTIEQFMENTWAPIPEQMAAFWKDSASSEQKPEIAGELRYSRPSRAALSEAPSLTRDATQSIASENPSVALNLMKEVLDARKRAKALKLALPPLSEEQKKEIERWTTSEEKLIAGTARALSSM